MPEFNDSHTSIDDLKSVVNDFIESRKWQSFHNPKNLAMSISIESAELLELFQWLTPEEAAQAIENKNFRESLKDEIADVLSYLLSLSLAANIDIASTLVNKMSKNNVKYPVEDCISMGDSWMEKIK